MTITICAYDDQRKAFGVAITSSSLAVAGRCVKLDGELGAVSSQNYTNPLLKWHLLEELSIGASAAQAVSVAIKKDPNADYRQLFAVDSSGGVGAFTGKKNLPYANHAEADGVVAGGNLLVTSDIPEQMIKAFNRDSNQPIEKRLLTALLRAKQAGGEKGTLVSAALFVCDGAKWPTTDLRIDNSQNPLEDLAAILELWMHEKQDYLDRALDPARAADFIVE